MKGKFLLLKDKEEKGKPSPQKQECGCPFPATIPSQPHTCFFADKPTDNNLLKNILKSF
jgi:hypothetical protein